MYRNAYEGIYSVSRTICYRLREDLVEYWARYIPQRQYWLWDITRAYVYLYVCCDRQTKCLHKYSNKYILLQNMTARVRMDCRWVWWSRMALSFGRRHKFQILHTININCWGGIEKLWMRPFFIFWSVGSCCLTTTCYVIFQDAGNALNICDFHPMPQPTLANTFSFFI